MVAVIMMHIIFRKLCLYLCKENFSW